MASELEIFKDFDEFENQIENETLSYHVLVESIKSGVINLDRAYSTLEDTKYYKDFVWKVAEYWNDLSRHADLGDLVTRIRLLDPNPTKMYFEQRWGIESALYHVTLKDAQESDLCDYIEHLVNTAHDRVILMLAHPGFSDQSREDFQKWLASLLTYSDRADSIRGYVLGKVMSNEFMYERCREEILLLASKAYFHELIAFTSFKTPEEFDICRDVVEKAMWQETESVLEKRSIYKLYWILEDDELTLDERSEAASRFALSLL